MDAIALPQDLASAHALILEMHARLHDLRGRYEDLQFELERIAKRMYGRRSEQLDPAQMQMAFAALQAEVAARGAACVPPAPPEPTPPPARPRQAGHGRRPLPPHLPRERRVVEPPPEDLVCPCCGEAKVKIGEDVSEQLDFVPATFKVIQTARPKYACPTCKEGVTVALVPRAPIAKGLATAGVLSHVVVSKYVDHQPLHRLTTMFGRLGVPLSRQTLCGWVGQVFALLALVEEALWRSVLSSQVLGADETPVKVLQEGRRQCARGYLWCYLGDRGEVVFDFSMGRRAETPVRALEEFHGRVLLCDAYAGYDRVERTKPDLVRAGCMAHARRGVYEAQDTDPPRALVLLAEFRLLYDVEAAIREAPCATEEERHALAYALRQERSVPVLARMKEHVERYHTEILPKSPLGKAVGYLRNQWDHLTRFAADGALAIDNNAVEREIRTVAVGRGNWTFIGHEDAGPWAARLYGLLGTCRLQGVNPFEWLKDVLERIHDHPRDRMHELTPRLWKAARAPPGGVSGVT